MKEILAVGLIGIGNIGGEEREIKEQASVAGNASIWSQEIQDKQWIPRKVMVSYECSEMAIFEGTKPDTDLGSILSFSSMA